MMKNKKSLIYLALIFTSIIAFATLSQSEYDEETSSFTTYDRMRYEHTSLGAMRIWDEQSGKLEGAMGFGLSGTVNGQSYFAMMNEFSWSWWLTNRTEDNIIIYTLNAYNNNEDFAWKQFWDFYPDRPVKIRHELENNLNNIEDFKVWYFTTIDEGTVLRYDETEYVVSFDELIFIHGNFNDILPAVHFPAHTFNYYDLIETNWTATDVLIGNASFLGSPETLIMGIGFQREDTTFRVGETITLDPSSTGFKSPAKTGDPSSDWTNGKYVKASNNNYTTETTVGDLLDTSNYSFGIPAGADIVGIEVQVEAKAGNVCVVGESARLDIDLSWDQGSSYTTSQSQTWVCLDGESIKTYGNSSDTWGRAWTVSELDNANFRARMNFSESVAGGDFNPGVDHIQVQVYYAENPPYTILNAPANASSFTLDIFDIILNATVYDENPEYTIDAFIYGVNSTSTADFYKHGLLHQELGVSNNTEITYNWTSPVTIPDSSTILLFHMDNNSRYGESDSLVYDFSDTGNNGTFGVPATRATANMLGGKFAGGFVFDGVNDRIDIPSIVEGLSEITVSAWVKADIADSGNMFIIDQIGAGDDTIGLSRQTGERYKFEVFNDAQTQAVSIGNVYADTNWHHVVGTYNGSEVHIYVDGVDDDSTPPSLTGVIETAAGSKLVIGSNTGSGGWNGTIDEVAIWNRSLSGDEIKNLYRLNVDKYFWKVNVTDSGGNNNESETREFDVIPGDSCSYTSGNWDIDLADSCVITSDVAGDSGANVTMFGQGTLIISGANLTGFDDYVFEVNGSYVSEVFVDGSGGFG